MSAGALATAILINSAWIGWLAARVWLLARRQKRDRQERLRDNVIFAHEIASLKRAHEIERDWYALQQRGFGE